MSRLTTGSAPNVGGNTKAELSNIVLELRVSLGEIPEVANAYGTPEDADDKYEDLKVNDAIDKGTYTDPFVSAGAKETESTESESTENYTRDINLQPQAPTPRESESTESDSDEKALYVDTLEGLQPRPDTPPVQDRSSQSFSNAAVDYEKVRKETDHRLAKLAKFLPDKVREGLDKKFDDAVNLARPNSQEGYRAATEALTKLQSSLDAKAPELRATENKFLRKQIKSTLDGEGGTLPQDDKKAFADRFASLDDDSPAAEAEAKSQLESLQNLADDIKDSIQGRLKTISDLCVDFERLTPIIERALSIEGDKQQELKQAHEDIKAGFGGKFVKDGLSIDAIQNRIASLDHLVREAFKNFTLDDAKEEQKRNLPASPESLQPFAIPIGSGAFGEVFDLNNDTDATLVGKSFQANNANAKKEMEHEAEIYARIGEHPNIAKCYGIHEVEGKSMLVMDKIEGKNVDAVFDDLNERYQEKEISREEYLAATQHIIKGTLMGLAHMEAMGLTHKDIKGDNIKFDTRTNQAVLIDMGLAQPEGKHLNPKFFFPISPPENFNIKQGEKNEVVTSLWDSFTVGKMLFSEMERDALGSKHALVTGGTPKLADKDHPIRVSDSPEFIAASRQALKRNDSGEFEAQTDEKGQLIGQALKPADDPYEAARPGRYGVETQYVDFMNRLTHPDPKQRMSPSEALKHPFMTDTFMSGQELDKVFGVATSRQKVREEAKDSDGENSGPRIDTDSLPGEYIYTLDAEREDSELEADEENSGPRIDTDLLPGEYISTLDAEREDSELEADEENSGPRIDTDLLTGEYINTLDAEHEDSELEADEVESEKKDTIKQPETEKQSETPKPTPKVKQPQPVKTQSKTEIESAMTKGTTALQRWDIAKQQVERQFNTAYASLGGDKAKLKDAGFTKGKKFSDYFTYNKDLEKLVKSLEEAKKKKTKDVPKLVGKVTEATAHYRDKIIRKADTDFGWANATPAVEPAFWKTLIAALDDVDKWVKS